MEWVASTLHTTSKHGVYPALIPLIRTPRVPVVDWTNTPADLNGLVRFAERRNLVSARVPSHFKRSLPIVVYIRCTSWWWAIDTPETGRVCLTEYTEHKLYIKLFFLYTNISRRSTVNETHNPQAAPRFSSAIHTYSSHGGIPSHFSFTNYSSHNFENVPSWKTWLTLRLLMSYIQGVPGGKNKTSGECSLC
jgi:hypothetical protein